MTIWDYISSTTDSIKRNVPDLSSSVTGLYRSSCDYSHAAVTNICNVVADKLYQHLPDEESRSKVAAVAVKLLHQYLPDEESRSKISTVAVKLYQHLPDEESRSRIAANLFKNSAAFAVQEGVKFFPGGSTAYTIVSRSLGSDKKSKDHKEDIQELKDQVGKMEKELSDYRELLGQNEIQKLIMELKSKSTADLNQKPEDVVRTFMMREFVGKHLLDNLIVPGAGSRKYPK